MDSKTQEILDILQEECGELIVQVSKVRRFGLEENRAKLTQECADVLTMISLLEQHEVFKYETLELACQMKREKLKQWSNIFTSEAKSPDLKFTTAEEYMKSSYRAIKEEIE